MRPLALGRCRRSGTLRALGTRAQPDDRPELSSPSVVLAIRMPS